LDLAELVHQALLGVQATGGVDDDGVDTFVRTLLDRVEGDACRVGALRTADDIRADAGGPGGELDRRRGPDRVGKSAQHAASVPQVVVLPVPLTPTTSTTAGLPSSR